MQRGASIARFFFKDQTGVRKIILSDFCNYGHRRCDVLGPVGKPGIYGHSGGSRFEANLSGGTWQVRPASRRRILAHPQDWHCVTFHFVCLAAYACAFWLYQLSHFVSRWFGRLWTFSGGWPSFFWEYCHVTIHHANLLTTEDWTLPKKRSDGSFESFQLYLFAHWPWRYRCISGGS